MMADHVSVLVSPDGSYRLVCIDWNEDGAETVKVVDIRPNDAHVVPAVILNDSINNTAERWNGRR